MIRLVLRHVLVPFIAPVLFSACGGCVTDRRASDAAPQSRPPTPVPILPARDALDGAASASIPAGDAGESTAPPLARAVFPPPDNVGPESYRVLGPFPIPPRAGRFAHPGLERDYLRVLGGESRAQFESDTTVAWEGKILATREATINGNGALDLAKLYGEGTDAKVAYAYAEWTTEQPVKALALFGSDDGAAVWLNGRQVHRVAANRALNPEQDHFDLALVQGKNRLLVKVDNGYGGWGFALRVYDDEGRHRLHVLDARRHLDRIDLRPASGDFLLDRALPEITFGDPATAELVFGKNAPVVRWFGPDLAPVETAVEQGRYTALWENSTLDGYPYRRMLTFAKAPRDIVPLIPSSPGAETPPLRVPGELREGQRAELARYFWRGGRDSQRHGEASAIGALGVMDLAAHPPPKGEPMWLHGAFLQAAEHQLALRIKLEGRTPKPLAPPETLPVPATKLRVGSEADARVRLGTVEKLRDVARDWAKADPNPFVVLLVRRGVVFMHEGFNGFAKDSHFYPASAGKTIAALLFARAVEQGLLNFDQPIGSVLPDWKSDRTAKMTFRYCFYHLTGLSDHRSHGGLFNAYLDNALLVQDALFARPGIRYQYNGDGFNLAGKALELVTGQSIWRLLYENMERPFGEPVVELDLGAADSFNAMYLAKVGQMILEDGRYGGYRFFQPGFLEKLRPQRIADYAPELEDKEVEGSIGLDWMPDPPPVRAKGALGPNVIGHGASSGTTWRIDPDHQLVVVIGRSSYKELGAQEGWVTSFMRTLASSLL